MDTTAQFVADCKATARQLRALPADVRRALAAEVKPRVAVPLAARIAGNLSGPYAAALSGAVKARASAEPVIVVGGAKRVVSGGAKARQLVYGTEFGGGKRVTVIPRTAKHKGFRRRSTRQFATAHPFVFNTVGSSMDWILDRYDEILEEVFNRGR